MTQNERVLDYMRKHGSITTLEAFRELGVSRLANVICDLRKEYIITSKTCEGSNRYGEKISYSRYYLRGKHFVNEERW